MGLTKDQILSADDRPIVDRNIKEWGGVVRIQTMTSEEHDNWEDEWAKWREENGGLDDRRHFNAFLASYVLVDDGGKRIFSIDDVPALARKSCKALAIITNAACRLNGIGPEEIEEQVKN